MRSIVWSEYISLDGVVDEPGSWSIPYFSDDLAKYKKDELWASDALLLGRITLRRSRRPGRTWRRSRATSPSG
jgi:hypothetical protein